MIIRTYSELIAIPSYEERYEYLRIGGRVGEETFGSRRWLNQILYHRDDWLDFRDRIIVRDHGRDLASVGFDIVGSIIIHHINPISYDDIINHHPKVLDPENAVCTKHSTHQAIHYGNKDLLVKGPIERTINDTCPWRH